MLGRGLSHFWNFITATKNAIGNIVLLLLVIFIAVTLFNTETSSVPSAAALVLNPSGIIVDQKQAVDPLANFLSSYENDDAETLLKDILDAIAAAEKDERIKILVLDLSKLQGSAFSKLEEIGDALEQFKTSGKPIYAFANAYNQTQYYIASHANEIYLNENSHQLLGGVFLTGLAVQPIYYKAALEKLKVNMHIYKAGKFKSAVEPYIRENMSAEAKQANLTWLSRLWHNYAETVTKQRDLTSEDFSAYTNKYSELLELAGSDPNLLAVQQKLVDDLISKQEWHELLIDIVGSNGSHFNYINLNEYLSNIRPPIPTMTPGSDKIAVITASGVIYSGDRPAGEIGSKSISKLIQIAREDDSVKAIVMRIDSPGGSASASEDIRVELVRTKAAGKPIVVSMSSYAASGGYWIAADANKIFALSTTITGSIGTFVTFPTLENTAAELGIYSDGVGTTQLSGALNPLKNVSPILDNALKQSVKFTYNKFLELVAKGRNMSVEAVDEIAQGRVWAAEDALQNGLIDAIGDLNDAISSAALLADIEGYEIIYLEKQRSPKEALLHEILNSSLETAYSAGVRIDFGFKNTLFNKFVPTNIQHLIEMSQTPDLYIECLECNITTH